MQKTVHKPRSITLAAKPKAKARATVARIRPSLRLRACCSWSGWLMAAAFLEGRDYVLPEDIKEVAVDVMNHRVLLNYEAEADNVSTKEIIQAILKRVPISN